MQAESQSQNLTAKQSSQRLVLGVLVAITFRKLQWEKVRCLRSRWAVVSMDHQNKEPQPVVRLWYVWQGNCYWLMTRQWGKLTYLDYRSLPTPKTHTNTHTQTLLQQPPNHDALALALVSVTKIYSPYLSLSF